MVPSTGRSTYYVSVSLSAKQVMPSLCQRATCLSLASGTVLLDQHAPLGQHCVPVGHRRTVGCSLAGSLYNDSPFTCREKGRERISCMSVSILVALCFSGVHRRTPLLRAASHTPQGGLRQMSRVVGSSPTRSSVNPLCLSCF